jgi:hypothetical protein
LQEIKNYAIGLAFQWHNVHTKFRENKSVGSKIERDDVISLLPSLLKEGR